MEEAPGPEALRRNSSRHDPARPDSPLMAAGSILARHYPGAAAATANANRSVDAGAGARSKAGSSHSRRYSPPAREPSAAALSRAPRRQGGSSSRASSAAGPAPAAATAERHERHDRGQRSSSVAGVRAQDEAERWRPRDRAAQAATARQEDDALAGLLASIGTEVDDATLALLLAQEEQNRQMMAMGSDEALALLLAHDQEAAFLAATAAAVQQGGRQSPGFLMAPPEMQQGLDVDRMSYDELLALEERMGYADRPNRARPEHLEQLPTKVVSESDCNGQDDCAVCCDSKNPGDILRILPCLHTFHKHCIDPWLLSDRPGALECPVCKTAVEF